MTSHKQHRSLNSKSIQMGSIGSIMFNPKMQSQLDNESAVESMKKIPKKVKNEFAPFAYTKIQPTTASQVLKDIYSSKRSINKSITKIMRRTIDVPNAVNNIFLYNNSVHHQNETIVTGAIKRSVSQSEKPVVEMKNHPYGPTFEIKSRNSKN